MPVGAPRRLLAWMTSEDADASLTVSGVLLEYAPIPLHSARLPRSHQYGRLDLSSRPHVRGVSEQTILPCRLDI
jgi:hypothetical protein